MTSKYVLASVSIREMHWYLETSLDHHQESTAYNHHAMTGQELSKTITAMYLTFVVNEQQQIALYPTQSL